jgi:hypothetical protein
MHLDAVRADSLVRLRFGIIRERYMPFALAHGLDRLYVLIYIERVVAGR